jgi:hypothetical protein
MFAKYGYVCVRVSVTCFVACQCFLPILNCACATHRFCYIFLP